MKLHCIGDSHTLFFMGYNIITTQYPYVSQSLFSNIYCHWLGPALAFSLNKEKSTIDSWKKIQTIAATLNPADDVLLFCFGEIDCRAHILYQSKNNGIPVNDVIKNTVDCYMETVESLIKKGFKVVTWNAVYSANFIDEGPNPDYPYYGSVAERNNATTLFNGLLSERAKQAGAYYIGISDLLFDQSSNLSYPGYYYDMIHLNNRLFIPAVKRINDALNGRLFSPRQFFIYYPRLMLAVAVIKITGAKKEILSALRKWYKKLKPYK